MTDDDTAETLAARTLVEEHRLYPAAIAMVLAGGWRIEGRRFVLAVAAAEAAASRERPARVTVGQAWRAAASVSSATSGGQLIPNWDVDRTDAATDEDGRVVLPGDARR